MNTQDITPAIRRAQGEAMTAHELLTPATLKARPETIADLNRAIKDARAAYLATKTRCECCGQMRPPTDETRRLRWAWTYAKQQRSDAKCGRCLTPRTIEIVGIGRTLQRQVDCTCPVVKGTLYCEEHQTPPGDSAERHTTPGPQRA